jgi:hypothetical protein
MVIKKVAHLPTEININKIITTSVKMNNLKKYSLILYENNEVLYIQTPLFNNILNINKKDNYIEFFVKITDIDFLNFLIELEKYIMNLAFINKNAWFDTIQNIKFKSLIKNLENNEDKVIKFKVPLIIKTKRLLVDSIDNINYNETELINIYDISNVNNIRFIININSIWFSNDLFGLYLKPVYVEEIILYEYTFQNNLNQYNCSNINKSLSNADSISQTNTSSSNNSIINKKKSHKSIEIDIKKLNSLLQNMNLNNIS